MSTTELINALYDLAYECEDMERTKLIREAAERLEELEEKLIDGLTFIAKCKKEDDPDE